MKNLTGQEIKFETRIPWIFNILPIFFIMIGLLGLIAFSFGIGSLKFIGFFLMYFLLKGGFKLSHNLTTKIYLTDTKITIHSGFIAKDIIDISLDKSESIWVYQGILGRIFNYGNLYISTAGMKINQTINKPLELRNLINKI